MRRAAAGLGLGLVVLAAPPAWSQPAQDPIDALLRPLPKDADVEEAEDTSVSPNAEQDPALPAGPQPYRPYVPPPHPTLTAPVFVHETGKNPDAPATPTEAAYDSRLRLSAASVQGFQGPMDGGWTLSAGGQALYALQLTDRNGAVEGAWRDLRRSGALDAYGFFDIVERTGGRLTFRFADGIVAELHPQGDRWTGELVEGGRRETVSLIRR
ncbi:MAG: hypothetical protein JHD15_20625 [Phenylobacterium sp.]|uniref:hypothetical protein n=1 Tax=Phenylobacterium sp. TaxID=1871053 RepID=UPI001A1BB4AD|nr:hypothetical protein [Phenylobacterium sp.]MBJ7412743.1 hypothetical protein [Phenylobacterium sp.]